MGDDFTKLTERVFRDLWGKTSEQWDERRRFDEVANQLGVDFAPDTIAGLAPLPLPASCPVTLAEMLAEGAEDDRQL
jgi:hypothetical protein